MRARAPYAVTKHKLALQLKTDDEDRGVLPNPYLNVIPDTLDKIWVADFTYIELVDSSAYLAAFLDACGREAVGYAISRSIDT